MFEVWDRVTGNLVDVYETQADAEAHIPVAYAEDFVVLEVEDELAT